jgi:hypothetical protein
MKRWRRPLLVMTFLLLAGAVVNVAVAWVLVGAPDSWTPGGPRTTVEQTYHDAPLVQAQMATRRLGAPDEWPPADASFEIRGLGWTQLYGGRRRLEETDWMAWRTDAGWPARSLVVTCTAPFHNPQERAYSPSIEPPRGLLPGAEWYKHRDRLPLTLAPAGFAVSTLFYAAILALPLSFFPLRRHLRAGRGRCPKCGYDRVGLADPAAPCPECGAQRRGSPLQTEALDILRFASICHFARFEQTFGLPRELRRRFRGVALPRWGCAPHPGYCRPGLRPEEARTPP